MKLTPGAVRRLVGVVAASLAVAACGAGPDEVAVAEPGSASATVVQGSELAGVRIDVRRDPG